MRFMMMARGEEPAGPPDPALMAAIDELSERMSKAGVLVEIGGLLPTFAGARVRVAGGKLLVTDGPFTETKELIGGYAILEAKSKEHAIELGIQFMQLHADILGPSYAGELEVRQMVEFQPAVV